MTDQTTRPLTVQQLAAIEARATAATTGPWGFYDGDNYAEVAADMQVTSPGSCSYRERVARLEDEDYWDDQAHDGHDEERAPEQMRANAAFISHARTDVPALLAEVRRQRLRIRELGELAARRESELIARRAALEEIRHLHKDSPMGPCPLCIDADALAAGGDGLMAYPCPTARLAGAQDCDPPTRAGAEEQPTAETPIGSITIRSESVELDNGECLRDLAIGDSVELRAETGHEGLWIAAAFHGDYQDRITLQYAEVVEDCGKNPALACEFSGTRHAHPVDLDGKVRPRPTP